MMSNFVLAGIVSVLGLTAHVAGQDGKARQKEIDARHHPWGDDHRNTQTRED
jgi:hypothetical protein